MPEPSRLGIRTRIGAVKAWRHVPQLVSPGTPRDLSARVFPLEHRGLVLLSEKLDLSAGIGVLSFSARSLTLVPSGGVESVSEVTLRPQGDGAGVGSYSG